MFINNNLNRGISTPIAILVIMVVAVIGGWLVLWQCSEMERETANITETQFSKINTTTSTKDIVPTADTKIDTSDWKIYRNEEYGFELKYPSDAKFLPSYEHKSEYKYWWGFAYNYGGKLNWSEDFEVMVDGNHKNHSLMEWIFKNEVCVLKLEETLTKNAEEIIVGGEKGIKLVRPGGTCPPGASSILIKAYILHSSKVYTIAVLWSGGGEEIVEQERSKFFDQMLSSFRFIE